MKDIGGELEGTPRTDMAVFFVHNMNLDGLEVVCAKLARDLEDELAAIRAEVENLRSGRDGAKKEVERLRAALRRIADVPVGNCTMNGCQAMKVAESALSEVGK